MTTSTETAHVVVVGASLAGLRACETLLQKEFAGSITLIGQETDPPYDRPPLSKKVLAGEWDGERIRLRVPDNPSFDFRRGVRAVGLDIGSRTVHVDRGTVDAYDALIIATGASPRRLPGQPDVDGVCVLRTLADAQDLSRRLGGGVRVVVIGAGFIGLEAAATARARGCQVTVLEGAPAPMIRGLGAQMGAAVATVHQRNDVQIHCGVQVAAIDHDGDRVTGVTLADGTHHPADVVLVGVGVAPNTAWLNDSGLALADGIVCDETLGALDTDGVFAAGDVARWTNPLFDEEMRVEHWTNANEQGAAAATAVAAYLNGEPPVPFSSVPFFWSEQFDRRIQFLGRAHGDDDVRVVYGDLTGPFVALYGYGGVLRGALGVNSPKLVMPYRTLIGHDWEAAVEFAASR